MAMKKNLLTLLFVILVCQTQLFAQSTKRILLEEFSTAPCGFCPDGDLVAAQLIIDHPSVIWVTHHAGFGTDSMTATGSVAVANAFTTFAPGACIDRGDYPIPVYTSPPYIAISRQKWDSVVVAHLNDPPVVDVTLTNQYDSVTRMLTCNVNANFITAPASGDFRLNLFLVEDSVVGFGSGYDQINYYNTTFGHPFYGAGNPIVGYVHHHVVRYIGSQPWGLSGVIPSTPVTGTNYSHTFSNISIPLAWKEDDIDVVAFVSYYNIDAHLRQVINAGTEPMKNGTTGIVNQSEQSVSVFPNPAAENIFIVSEKAIASVSSFILKDISGKTIREYSLEKGNMSFTLPVNEIANGIYFYSIRSAEGILSNGKIAVSR